MFGGLELKQPAPSSSSNHATENGTETNSNTTIEKKSTSPAAASITDSISSAFSFLQTSLPSAPPPTLPGGPSNTETTELDVPTEDTSSTTAAATATVTATATAQPSSAFSFMSSMVSTPPMAPVETETYNDVPSNTKEVNDGDKSESQTGGSLSIGGTSGFSFLSQPATTTAPPAPAPADGAALQPPTTSLPTSTPVPVTAPAPAPATWAAPTSNSSLPQMTPTIPMDILNSSSSTSSIPATSGITFGGVAPKKHTIKKRRATKKIGIEASNIPPPSSIPIAPNDSATSTQSVSTTTQLSPPKPLTHIASTGTLSDDAEYSRKKAEEFMEQKLRDQSQFQHDQDHQDYQDYQEQDKISGSEPESPTFAKAQQAAEDAKNMASKKNSNALKSFRMGNIFSKSRSNLPFFRDNSQNSSHSTTTPATPHNSISNLSASSIQNIEDESNQSTHQHDSSLDQEQYEQQHQYTVPSIQINHASPKTTDKEESTRISQTEEQLQKMKQKEEQERLQALEKAQEQEQQRLAQLQEQEQLKRAAEKAAEEAKKPQNRFQSILTHFQTSTTKATQRVLELRSLRAKLLEEVTIAEKKERLASYQIHQAEKQQTMAAEKEDFDLADRLAAVIDGYVLEKKEQTKILDHIHSAIEEVDNQREDVVKGLTLCFTQVQETLTAFQFELDTAEREDGNEALENFAATSKRLSVEDERLNNELKHIERDEDIVEEERKQIESSISNQCQDVEQLRQDAKNKLDQVNDEIEALRKLLATKEAIASELSSELAVHEEAISKVREKFSRQLNRLSKKEASVMENRKEWNSEIATLNNMKERHEADLQAHHEALISYEKMMESVKTDIQYAEQLKQVISKEIVVENVQSCSSEKEELKILQADVVKSEAAAAEAKQLVLTSEGAMEALADEMKEIEARLPILDAEKRDAASRRDFKGAGKASREIKEATARREQCMEEMAGEALERVESSKKELEALELEAEEKKLIAQKKEEETEMKSMVQIAEKIIRLEKAKISLKSDESNDDDKKLSVSGVGAEVLQGEIVVLTKKGENLGEKYGGWDEILAEQREAANLDQENETDVVINDKLSPEEKSMNEDKEEEICETDSNIEEQEEATEALGQDEPEPTTDNVIKEKEVDADADADAEEKAVMDKETVLKWMELKKEINTMEAELESAVEEEEYDKAAELDETLETLKADLKALNVSEEELQAAMEHLENQDSD